MHRMLAAAALALAPVAAPAATMALYTPGGAPCNGGDYANPGICDYEWALVQAKVPRGEPVRMMVPAGSMIIGMAYAKDGKPLWTKEAKLFADEQPGIGYYFTVDGHTYIMAKLDVCGNWTVVAPPVPTIDVPPTVTGYVPPTKPPVVVPFCPTCGPIITEPECETDCEPPPAVPVPASGLLLLTALGLVLVARKK